LNDYIFIKTITYEKSRLAVSGKFER